MKKLHLLLPVLLLLLTQCGPKWTESGTGQIHIVDNPGGKRLGYAPSSGVQILTVDRLAFKDLNKNGSLDPYEDWRLSADERAKDLATKMSIEQIAGLMLYSGHQAIPARGSGRFGGTYGGKPFDESGAAPSTLSDDQIRFLTEDNLRHVLITSVESPEVAATWNNNMQELVEGKGLGIPANNSSDPRHGTKADAEYNAGSGGAISMWPGQLGLAATFDPMVVQGFGTIASKEYRALGIATALSPQIDLATEPRWSRVSGTFGENPDLATDMARAYVDGFQTSSGSAEIADGWGYESVNTMVKHWPGGGSGEGGRDAHYGYGKFAVYPGNNIETQLLPFTQGAFQLNGPTKSASAVMPYYTISYNQDIKNSENVGNGYSKYLITDLLRSKYGYDGVVCTDWLVTGDEAGVEVFSGKSWGMEKSSLAERHYKVLMAGVDQFGGNNDAKPVMEAYEMGVKEHGEDFMRKRFEQSAVRLLKNIFRVGLFENPYLDIETTKAIVGNPEFMKAGYDAQLKSIVMVKNKNKVLPLDKKKTVYIPKRNIPARRTFFGMVPGKVDYPVNMEMAKRYFNVTDDPEAADYALVVITSPDSGPGYDKEDVGKGGNGYVPISLQYKPYRATEARDSSIAGGDPFENFTNRSYKNKSVKTANASDLDLVVDTKRKMKGKPVVVSIHMTNPTVLSEIEAFADAILIDFQVQDQVIFDVLSGSFEPSGLLPLQMPADMSTVEHQFEDVVQDMKCFVDHEGNTYDFAFGLNWTGIIQDQRVNKYKKK